MGLGTILAVYYKAPKPGECMFDLGDAVVVKTTGEHGTVVEFLRRGDSHRGLLVRSSKSFVVYEDGSVGEWLSDEVLEAAV